MILATLEKPFIEDTNISQMGEAVVPSEQKNLSLSKSVDLSEFAFASREVVNFENASVNIDNSNDVIIGPVTQFNVNGNVTFVQNANDEELDKEKRDSTESSFGTGKILHF